MGSLGTPLGISGLIMIIIGIIMIIISIILLVIYHNVAKPWYIWVVMALGVILSIIGGILLAVALSSGTPDKEVTPVREITHVKEIVSIPVISPTSTIVQPKMVPCCGTCERPL